MFSSELQSYCANLENRYNEIAELRKPIFKELADYITSKVINNKTARLIFICTHNSRRSHLGQLWAQTAALYYGIENIETFSGGTEATAFNPRAVEAIKKTGFIVDVVNTDSENPHYMIKQAEPLNAYEAFSKVYSDHPNPQESFCAIMVCSSADEGCPFIPGAEKRISLPYDDPKDFDGTDLETTKYDERCAEIARDMFYTMSLIKR